MNSFTQRNLAKLILLHLYLWLGLETLTGLSTLYLAPLTGLLKAYKAVPLLLCAIYCINNTRVRLITLTVYPVIVMLLFLQLILLINPDFNRTVEIIFKTSLAFFFYFFLSTAFNRSHITPEQIINILKANTAFFLFNCYLYYFNIGFANYTAGEDQEFGGTGFFYAGNETSACFIVLYGLNLLINQRTHLFWTFLFGLACIAITSKTVIASYIVITLISFARTPKNIFVIAIPAISLLAYNIQHIFSIFRLAINRWNYFIDAYGLETYLLGGYKRLSTREEYFSFIEHNQLVLFHGLGWTGTMENNFYDYLEAFGLIGLLIYSYWILQNIQTYLRQREPLILVTAALVCVASFFAGHVLQSSLFAICAPLFWSLHLYYEGANKQHLSPNK